MVPAPGEGQTDRVGSCQHWAWLDYDRSAADVHQFDGSRIDGLGPMRVQSGRGRLVERALQAAPFDLFVRSAPFRRGIGSLDGHVPVL